jgi:hypothetical protein
MSALAFRATWPLNVARMMALQTCTVACGVARTEAQVGRPVNSTNETMTTQGASLLQTAYPGFRILRVPGEMWLGDLKGGVSIGTCKDAQTSFKRMALPDYAYGFKDELLDGAEVTAELAKWFPGAGECSLSGGVEHRFRIQFSVLSPHLIRMDNAADALVKCSSIDTTTQRMLCSDSSRLKLVDQVIVGRVELTIQTSESELIGAGCSALFAKARVNHAKLGTSAMKIAVPAESVIAVHETEMADVVSSNRNRICGCASNADCAIPGSQDRHCVAGSCASACRSPAQGCDAGETCVDGRCASCINDSSCEYGEYCDRLQRGCVAGCRDSVDCVPPEQCRNHQCE